MGPNHRQDDSHLLVTYCRYVLEEMQEIEGIFWGKGWDWQLSGVIKKFKPDLLLTSGLLCKSGLTIPQCAWIPTGSNKTWLSFFYKRRLQNTLLSARIIFTDSEKNRQKLIFQYSLDAGRVVVLYPLADDNYGVLPAAEKENVKRKFAAAKEYFVVNPPYPTTGELLHLLKAFSLFKKRQQSNMQLLLAGSDMEIPIEFYEKLETYKHQADIHVYDFLKQDELTKIVAGAYAMLYPFDKGSGRIILNAFQSQVPVIAADESSLSEISTDAALYADPMNHEQFANQLSRIFKDEKLRNEIIENGKIRSELFSRRLSIGGFWKRLAGIIKN